MVDLLPLMSTSPSRVVSILDASTFSKLIEDDLELKTHYSILNCAKHCCTMLTLSLQELAEQNPETSFVHLYPGIVKTHVLTSGFSRPVALFMKWVITPLLTPFTLTISESGERNLYHLISERYPSKTERASLTKGSEVATGLDPDELSGAYALNWNGDEVAIKPLVKELNEAGTRKKVWDFTNETLAKIANAKPGS
jgi:hypothetical protein